MGIAVTFPKCILFRTDKDESGQNHRTGRQSTPACGHMVGRTPWSAGDLPVAPPALDHRYWLGYRYQSRANGILLFYGSGFVKFAFLANQMIA